MEKEIKKENNKKKSQGDTFYEAMPAAVSAPQEIQLPKISVRTADFLESIVIFFAGMVGVLMMLRIFLMIFGVNGGNLLSYLLYAASYPFVLLLNSGQGQVPEMTNKFLYENIALLVIYLVVFYGLLKLINAFAKANEN